VISIGGINPVTMDILLKKWATIGLAMGRHMVQSLRIFTYGATFALVAWGVSQVIQSIMDTRRKSLEDDASSRKP
jgi:hypothetical protein